MDPNTPSAIQLASGGIQSVPPPVIPAPKPQPAITPQSPVSDLKVAPTAPIPSPVAAPTAPVSTEKPFTTPNTGVVQNPNTGLYEAYANGQRISTGTQSAVQSALDRNINSLRSSESMVTTPVASDSSTVTNEERSSLEQYKSMVSEPVLDTKYIDDELTALEARRQSEIANINSTFDSLRVTQEGQQKSETGTTSAALARAGGYLGNSGSGTGVLLNLAQSHRAEVQSLEAKRQQAINEAQAAFQDKQFALVRQKVDLAREYQKEMKNRQIEYFDLVRQETDRQKTLQEAQSQIEREQQVDNAIYTAIQSGLTDGTDIYGALQGQATPDEISKFISKLKPKTVASDAFKPSNTQTALLLGAGMGQEDIQALTDTINAIGYTDEVKAQLSAYQRRVMDSIFTMKPENAKGVGNQSELYKILSPSSLKSLDDIGLEVKPGDTLADVAARHKISEEQVSEVVQAEQEEPGFFSKIGSAIADLFNNGNDSDIDAELKKMGL